MPVCEHQLPHGVLLAPEPKALKHLAVLQYQIPFSHAFLPSRSPCPGKIPIRCYYEVFWQSRQSLLRRRAVDFFWMIGITFCALSPKVNLSRRLLQKISPFCCQAALRAFIIQVYPQRPNIPSGGAARGKASGQVHPSLPEQHHPLCPGRGPDQRPGRDGGCGLPVFETPPPRSSSRSRRRRCRAAGSPSWGSPPHWRPSPLCRQWPFPVPPPLSPVRQPAGRPSPSPATR